MDTLELGLAGKVAIVTGGSEGLGLACVERFARSGAKVAACARRKDVLERGVDQVRRATGGDILAMTADVTKGAEVEAFVKATLARFGGVDILVNNAGLQHVAPVEEFPVETWERLVRVMLFGAFYLTRAALPHMYAKGWGRIVNIASVHGLVASPYKSAYVAAKHGLVGFTKAVALEAAEKGVTVNAVCPSYVRTPLVEKQIADQAKVHGISEDAVIRDIMLAPAALKRLLEPSEVAAYVRFLCSDEASGITGATQVIDAGWTAR